MGVIGFCRYLAIEQEEQRGYLVQPMKRNTSRLRLGGLEVYVINSTIYVVVLLYLVNVSWTLVISALVSCYCSFIRYRELDLH